MIKTQHSGDIAGYEKSLNMKASLDIWRFSGLPQAVPLR
jgi:hypothetical protein